MRQPVKISEMDLFLVDAPDPLPGSNRSLLIHLVCDSGEEGWGEVSGPWRSSDLAKCRDLLLPCVVDHNPFEIEELLSLDVVAASPARTGLEMACWDLVGKIADQPLCNLWGGSFRPRVPLTLAIHAADVTAAGSMAREMVEQGVHTLIVAASGEPEHDLEVIRTLGEAMHARGELWLDGANLFDLDVAVPLCQQLQDAQVRMLIDPLPDGDLVGMHKLAQLTNLSLGLSRCVHKPADVFRIGVAKAAQSVVIDIQRVGGLQQARRCAAVADAADLTAALYQGGTAGVAVAAMMHLAATTPELLYSNVCQYRPQRGSLLVEPLDMSDGMLSLPTGSGLGVEVDRSDLEQRFVAAG